MQRDVTRIRNIGIITSVDAGIETCRERIFELTGIERTTAGQSPSADKGAVAPANVGRWASRSGPFADEPASVTILQSATRAIDGALLVLDGARGAIEAAESAFRAICARHLPCIAFIDDASSIEDVETMLDAFELDLGMTAVAVHLPWNDHGGAAVIDVLEQRLVVERGRDRELRPIPVEAQDAARRMRQRIVDVCGEGDDSILGASAAGLDVGGDELARALRKTLLTPRSRVLVVTCGSLRARRGVGVLLDAVVTYLPSPADRPPIMGFDPRRCIPVARFAREGDALAATVLAMTEAPSLGRLTWVRVYSGAMEAGTPIVVLPREAGGHVERIFVPEGGGLFETDWAGPGAVVCITGSFDAWAGETLSSVRAPVVLDGAEMARHGVPSREAIDGVGPTQNVWSVARSVRRTGVLRTSR